MKPTISAPIVAQLTPFLFDFPSSQDGPKTSQFLDISDISVTTYLRTLYMIFWTFASLTEEMYYNDI